MYVIIIAILVFILCFLSYEAGKNDAKFDYNKGRLDAYDSVLEELHKFQERFEKKG